MSFRNDCERFERETKSHRLSHVLVSDHREAAERGLQDFVVYAPDYETGTFDVYIVGEKGGVFTEYVSWVSDEFIDDPELLGTVINYITGAFKGPLTVPENLKAMNPNLLFAEFVPDNDV